MREYGLDGVIIGRAAIGNPWFFRDVGRAMQGLAPAGCSAEEWLATLRRHMDDLVALRGLERRHRRPGHKTDEQAAVMAFRPHLIKYVQGLPGWHGVRRQLNDLTGVEAVLQAIAAAIELPERIVR